MINYSSLKTDIVNRTNKLALELNVDLFDLRYFDDSSALEDCYFLVFYSSGEKEGSLKINYPVASFHSDISKKDLASNIRNILESESIHDARKS